MGKGERRVWRQKVADRRGRAAGASGVPGSGGRVRGSGGPRRPPGAGASGAARVLAGGAPRGQSGRASGEGRGLLAPAPRVLLFAHTRIQRAIRPSGILFPFFSLLNLVCVFNFFFNRDMWQCWGEETVLRGIYSLPHFFFCLSSSFFFLVKALNIPRS